MKKLLLTLLAFLSFSQITCSANRSITSHEIAARALLVRLNVSLVSNLVSALDGLDGQDTIDIHPAFTKQSMMNTARRIVNEAGPSYEGDIASTVCDVFIIKGYRLENEYRLDLNKFEPHGTPGARLQATVKAISCFKAICVEGCGNGCNIRENLDGLWRHCLQSTPSSN